MNIKEYKRLAEEQNKKFVRIYNPDTEDFTVIFHNEPYTIRALEMDSFPFPIAEHIKKHLADHLLNKRGTKSGSNPQDSLEIYKKEIEVALND